MDKKKLATLQTRLAAATLPTPPRKGSSEYHYYRTPDTTAIQQELAAIATTARTLLAKATLRRGAAHQAKLTKLAEQLTGTTTWGTPERLELKVLRSARTALAGVLNALESESRTVFIVHGHDTAMRQDVKGTLAQFGITGLVLSEELDQGATIIEKFEQVARTCGYAVVLCSPDDVGGLKAGRKTPTLAPRARQNVILELGYFVGVLGRKKVFVLVGGATLEMPSDFAGVVYQQYDKAGSWKRRLANELEAAGFHIDPVIRKKI